MRADTRVKKFAWLPTEVYIYPFWRDGGVLFQWVYVNPIDGKAYRSKGKPKIRCQSGEDLSELELKKPLPEGQRPITGKRNRNRDIIAHSFLQRLYYLVLSF